tara:strand:- start:30 stop:716 length:687 start_codon:yes stop_codon:yes gene_type:complete
MTKATLTRGQKRPVFKEALQEIILRCVNRYGVCTLSTKQIIADFQLSHNTQISRKFLSEVLQELEDEKLIAFSNNPKKGVNNNWIGRFFKIVIHPTSELYAKVLPWVKKKFGHLWNHLSKDIKNLKSAIKRALRWGNLIPSKEMKNAIVIAKTRKSIEYRCCTKRYGQTPNEFYKSREEQGYHLIEEGSDFEIITCPIEIANRISQMNHLQIIDSSNSVSTEDLMLAA